MNKDELITKLNEQTAPKITPEIIEGVICEERYYIFPGTTVTVCLLILKNGYSALGESACVSLENFNRDIGRAIARENAIDKIWALEGYLLKQRLSEV